MHFLILKLNELYGVFVELSKSSPVIAGALSLWGLGVITFIFKGLLPKIWHNIIRQTTTSLVVNSSDAIYYELLTWVSKNKMHGFVRSLTLSKEQKFDMFSSIVAMGYGRSWFLHGGKIMFMDRREVEANQTADAKEQIVLTVFSRNHTSFRKLFDDIKAEQTKDIRTRILVWKDGYWTVLSKHFPRPLDTIALPEAQREDIVNRIDDYLRDKDWYAKNGIPWRLGVLLSGSPGTGKTSLVKGLCAHYNKNLYMIDLNSMTDASLLRALGSLPEGAICCIEDIDAAGIENRVDGSVDEEKYSSLTLAGVLNAIDGPASGEGRILIATTNHPEKLDPALIRPGRFDIKAHITYMTDESFRSYMKRFFPDLDLSIWSIKPGIAPCEVQNLIFMHRDNPKAILAAVCRVSAESMAA